jgi:hypothetical protein
VIVEEWWPRSVNISYSFYASYTSIVLSLPPDARKYLVDGFAPCAVEISSEE